MKILSKGQVFLLIVCLAVLLYSYFSIEAVPDRLQYMIPAPAVEMASESGQKETELNHELRSLHNKVLESAEEWSNVLLSYSMDGIIEKASVTGPEAVTQARLTFLDRNGAGLRSLIPRFGRLIYPEELEQGAHVILIDEKLALQLFRIAEPLGKKVTVGSESYTVIGVLRHERQVGDSLDYCAFAPLKSVYGTALQLDAICLTANPVPGTGANTFFQSTMNTLLPGGTFTDLGKERIGAWLWLRMLIFLLGTVVLLRCVKVTMNSVVIFADTIRKKLRDAYLLSLLPWITGKVLSYVICFAAAAMVFVYLMNMILAPVYVFPEWIPPVLVEWSDIQDTFWKVWKNFAVMKEMRSTELIRLRFFTLLIDGFSALAGVILFSAYRRYRTNTETVLEALHGQYRLGTSVTSVITDHEMAYEKLGYVPINHKRDSSGTQMVRIISAERVLKEIPPSRKKGSFVVEISDSVIKQNQARFEISCDGKTNQVKEAKREWDMQFTVTALTRLVFGQQNLQSFLETETGCELRVRNEAMDGFFCNHLSFN